MTEFLRPDPSPIPTDGLSAVVSAGRRRRARLSASTGAAAAGLAVVAVLAGGPAGNQSLRPVSESPAPGSASPVRDPSASASPPATGEPAPGASATTAPPEEPSATPTADPGEPAPPSPEPSRSPIVVTPESGRTYAHHNAMRDGVSVMPPGTHSSDATVWLVRPKAERKAVLDADRPRTTYDLELSICNAWVNTSRTDPQELHYGTTQEADVEVVDADGQVVWRWSRAQSFASDRHVRQVRSGQCYWWATEWDGVDDDGRLVPAGTYVARLASTADGWGFEGAADVELTVS